MKLKFNDGTIREIPDDPSLGARLIHLSQQKGNADFRVEIDEGLPAEQKEKQLAEVQHYVDWYRMRTAIGKKI